MSCRHNFKLRAIGSMYTCTKCDMYVSVEMYQQLQQAHRQGWEQCRREAQEVAKQTDFPPSPKSYYTLGRVDAANAIAAMEYGGKAND